MRAAFNNHGILTIRANDLPQFKKEGGSIVRNTFFWSLKSIACYTGFEKDWEYDQEVWVALKRMLISFADSGYLGTSETCLEFNSDTKIPNELRSVSIFT